MEYLTIALPKGKLFDRSVKVLAKVGCDADNVVEDSRKLVITNKKQKSASSLSRPWTFRSMSNMVQLTSASSERMSSRKKNGTSMNCLIWATANAIS